MKKRLMIALLAAGVVFGAAYAMAASLGGVSSDNLGSSGTVVASCDSDGVDTSYNTSYASVGYVVDSVNVTDIAAACDNQKIKVTLSTTDGVSDPASSGGPVTVSGGSAVVPISGAAIDRRAEIVTGVHVVISNT